MSIEGFTKAQSWTEFNSSLLIEVTRPSGTFVCTGVAISRDLVVTAAHCLEGEITGVKIFTQDKQDPQKVELSISSFTIHPQYNPKISRYRYDIAKIVMKDKIPASVLLHKIYTEAEVKGQLFRFGFGERNKKNLRTVITPKFRKINLVDQVVELNDTFSYSGDSGGPIFIQNGKEIELLAIHSTLSFGPQGKFSYNPLLSIFMPWIYSN